MKLNKCLIPHARVYELHCEGVHHVTIAEVAGVTRPMVDMIVAKAQEYEALPADNWRKRGLSTRAVNGLRGIFGPDQVSDDEIRKIGFRDLLRWPNIGKTGASEITEMIGGFY